MRRWCMPCPQGGISVLNTVHCHNSCNPKSVSCKSNILRLPTTYCCNKKHNSKAFHKLSGKNSNLEHIYRSKPALHIVVSTTAECSDEVNKNKRNHVQQFMEFSSRQIDMLSSGWLPKMGRSYGLDLMMVLGLGYWVQGFRIFPWWALNFYLKENLRLDPGTMQFLQNTVNLPMVAKPVYGIFSDAVYIGGAHRLPYICIGGRCSFFPSFSLFILSVRLSICSSLSCLSTMLIFGFGFNL